MNAFQRGQMEMKDPVVDLRQEWGEDWGLCEEEYLMWLWG